MIYRIYHAVGPNRHVGYRKRDRLWLDPEGYFVDATHSDAALPAANALALIYEDHQFEDRPDVDTAPPIAVGDVVALEVTPGATVYAAVTEAGFEMVDPPRPSQLSKARTFEGAVKGGRANAK